MNRKKWSRWPWDYSDKKIITYNKLQKDFLNHSKFKHQIKMKTLLKFHPSAAFSPHLSATIQLSLQANKIPYAAKIIQVKALLLLQYRSRYKYKPLMKLKHLIFPMMLHYKREIFMISYHKWGFSQLIYKVPSATTPTIKKRVLGLYLLMEPHY